MPQTQLCPPMPVSEGHGPPKPPLPPAYTAGPLQGQDRGVRRRQASPAQSTCWAELQSVILSDSSEQSCGLSARTRVNTF